MARKKQSPGRPPKPDGEVRMKALTIRLTPAEHAELVRLAADAGRSVARLLVVSTLRHPAR